MFFSILRKPKQKEESTNFKLLNPQPLPGTPGEGSQTMPHKLSAAAPLPALSDAKVFRPLRRATKDVALGTHHLCKGGRNFYVAELCADLLRGHLQ